MNKRQELISDNWQIEMLISGGLLLTMYQLPFWINSWLEKVVNDTDFSTSRLLIFVGLIVISRALLIGFGINLILRAIWLASRAVSDAYPEGIDYEKLNYSEEFTIDHMNQYSGNQKTAQLDKWAGLSYSLAIILTVFSLGIVITMVFLYKFIFEQFLTQDLYDSNWFGYSVLVIVTLLSFGILDWLVFNKLKTKEKLQRWFLPISKALSIFNLSYFIKNEWLVLLTNSKRFSVYSFSIIYFAISVLLSLTTVRWDDLKLNISNPLDDRVFLDVDTYNFYKQNDEYDDYIKEDMFITGASISSERIESNSLPVFISYDRWYDYGLSRSFKKYNYIADQSKRDTSVSFRESSENLQKALNATFKILLNGEGQDSLRWFMKNHHITNQEGFTTTLDLSNVKRGNNSITVLYVDERGAKINTIRWIPFWKE